MKVIQRGTCVVLFVLLATEMPISAEEPALGKGTSSPVPTEEKSAVLSRPAQEETSTVENKSPDAHASLNKVSETELRTAVEKVLREQPHLILNALKDNPVALAELVERAAEIRKVQAEEARWRAELKQPKVPEIAEERHIRGNRKAPVTIVEYSDFECPYCRAVSPTLHSLFRQYEGTVSLVYKHNPLNFHPTAEPAARYFEAIALQNEDEAWHFHDLVFERQHNLDRGVEVLREISTELNIDHERLERDLHSDTVTQRLAADRAEAERFGFDGTPAFVINGVSLVGNHPKRDFDRIIKLFTQSSEARAH